VTRIRWWCALGLLSAGIIELDIVTAPYIHFPIMFVIPVGLGAWYLSRGAAIGFAVVLVGCRFGIVVALEREFIPVWAAAVNAGIRLVVLVGLAEMVSVALQKRILAERVQLLEGLLSICSFCKKIRRPDGMWDHIEVYVSERSNAQFSHGFCEACAREHYGEYLRSPDSKGAEPGAAPDRRGTTPPPESSSPGPAGR
jgi:hypothetical protein